MQKTMNRISHVLDLAGKRLRGSFEKVRHYIVSLPAKASQGILRLSIRYSESLVREYQDNADQLLSESTNRRQRKGRKEFADTRTMELDSNLVRAMDEVKKAKKELDEKKTKLLS